MSKGLTDRQREVFEYICSVIRKDSRPPTVREISDFFNFKSPKAASDHLGALERKGYIVRKTSKARNIKIPDKLSPQGIPLLGRIPAGSPIMSMENIETTLTPSNLFGENGDTFAVQMKDDSMKLAGIVEGDYVVIAYGHDVEDGQKAVVTLEKDADPTVRTVHFKGKKSVKLVPDNPDYDETTIKKDTEGFRIVGPVKGIFRKV